MALGTSGPLGAEDQPINVNNAFSREIPTVLKSAFVFPLA
jgi:hypothetical protein